MHAARWDRSYDLAGKNVVMISTRASGIQVGLPLAQIASKFAIYQRSAPWALQICS